MGLEGDKETKMEEAQAWGFLLCVHHSTNEGSSMLESMSAPSIREGNFLVREISDFASV